MCIVWILVYQSRVIKSNSEHVGRDVLMIVLLPRPQAAVGAGKTGHLPVIFKKIEKISSNDQSVL